LFLCGLSYPLSGAFAADFKREVIYQIITDRFYDGNSANNNPRKAPACTTRPRPTGGLLGRRPAGIQAKMSYLAGMGVTAIGFLRPSIIEHNIPTAAATRRLLPRYQGRDFKRIESTSATAATLDRLRRHGYRGACGRHKVIVDFAPTTPRKTAPVSLARSTTRHLPRQLHLRQQWYFITTQTFPAALGRRYQVEYFTLFDLADLNQEHATIDAYMKSAAQLFQQHGVAVPHRCNQTHTGAGSTASQIPSYLRR